MEKRHVILIDITGLQTEDMKTIVDTIRALHNVAFTYNLMTQVSATDDQLEPLYVQEIKD